MAISSIMISMNKELTDKQHSFLEHLVEQGGDPKKANMRLQAAQTILDRVGLGRSERIDVSHKAEGGLFILPSKQEVIIDGEYEEA